MILAALEMLTTNISKCIQTLDQMIFYKATKHQPRIIQTPTQNHRKITSDILDGIPTSRKEHPTACSKSSTSPNDQPHIIQEPTQNHPNITKHHQSITHVSTIRQGLINESAINNVNKSAIKVKRAEQVKRREENNASHKQTQL